jgi:hypothetical protein
MLSMRRVGFFLSSSRHVSTIPNLGLNAALSRCLRTSWRIANYFFIQAETLELLCDPDLETCQSLLFWIRVWLNSNDVKCDGKLTCAFSAVSGILESLVASNRSTIFQFIFSSDLVQGLYMCKKTSEYLESCGQINRLIKIGLSGGFNITQTVDRFMSNFRALLISGNNCFDAQFLGALAVVADFLSSQQRIFCQIGFKSRIRF